MFRLKFYKNKAEVPQLPTELLLVIFDIVIEEGIIRLDQCDYTTFLDVSSAFSSWPRYYQFYNSYYRLRLVCRRFNTLLGARPWQSFSTSSSLPFPVTTRSLYIDLKLVDSPHFQRLFAEASSLGRLVSLDVDCDIPPRRFLEDSAGQGLPNVQRLVIRVRNRIPYVLSEGSLWTLLHRVFPFLVTFVLLAKFRSIPWKSYCNELVCFERLEILHINVDAPYSGCHFPRLRHASVWRCSLTELDVLLRSPHLESLLITSYNGHCNLTSCPRLKLFGCPENASLGMTPLDRNHPLEHIWIYSPNYERDLDHKLLQQLSERLPKISRITLDFSSSYPGDYSVRIDQFRALDLSSFGLTVKLTGAYYRPTVVIERIDTVVTEGTLKKVWRKMRR